MIIQARSQQLVAAYEDQSVNKVFEVNHVLRTDCDLWSCVRLPMDGCQL